MPMGLWHALPFDISPLANHLHLDDQFEQSSLQMLHRDVSVLRWQLLQYRTLCNQLVKKKTWILMLKKQILIVTQDKITKKMQTSI